MFVEYVLRADAPNKRGGDLIQATRYCELMNDRGLDARISYGAPKYSEGIVHVFSVDRPVEFVRVVDKTRKQQRPLVVSAIHHSASQVRRFREVRRGLLGLAERRVSEPVVEVVKDAIRSVQGDLAYARGFRPVYPTPTRIRDGLNYAASIQVLAEGEARWLAEDFSYLGPTKRIPNGVDPTPQRVGVAREFDVIVVGRLEERKNQLQIARTLAKCDDLRIVFLGHANSVSKSYLREFEGIVRAAPSLEWIKGVPKEEVDEMLLRSRVYVSASFFEVLSLADLEAAAAGCSVIASKNGNTQEYLGESARYVDPWRVEHDLESLVRLALGEERRSAPEIPTWREVADSLVSEYCRAATA